MKRLLSLLKILTFIFLLPINVNAYNVDFDQWRLIEGSDNLKVYSRKGEKGHKLSIQLRESHFKNWQKKNAKEVYDQFLEKKKKMLALLRIKNWKVTSKEWQPKVAGAPYLSRLEVKGTYENSRGDQVHFHEVHEFSKGEKRQYLFTQVKK